MDCKMHGIMVILKPPGMTSHDVVAMARHLTKQRQIGHAGTLDPGAAGVLVLCLGHATRLIPFMEDYVKSYRAELRLGWSTDSQDAGGEIGDRKRDFALYPQDFARAFASLQKRTEQIPPMVSALKHQGQRLYELARQGKVVTRQPRTIRIYSLEPVEVMGEEPLSYGDRFLFDVTCSKGTYVRTICHDLGVLLGVPTHMSFLLRTRVGPWRLSDATALEALTEAPCSKLFAMDQGVSHLPGLVMSEEGAKRLRQGARVGATGIIQSVTPIIDVAAAIGSAGEHEALVRLYEPDGRFLGIGRRQSLPEQGWEIQPLRMLPFKATDGQ